ncbi:hypothetical protein [Paenibacillus foliorum]|uniref:hypothetical protein n=1 Tax=Paenibacillus foliorum TaxID=2654974 RepID=UPI00149111DD|nr:hypothetical protein [Paenibacillus foliorum]
MINGTTSKAVPDSLMIAIISLHKTQNPANMQFFLLKVTVERKKLRKYSNFHVKGSDFS